MVKEVNHHLTDFKDQLAVYFKFFKDHPDLMKLFLNAGLEGELLNQQTKFLK
ncbi:transcriptional regulator, partial [Lactobacillus salivarius]|nr:transcriptional regulator [Ligilactobacillus salivarius]